MLTSQLKINTRYHRPDVTSSTIVLAHVSKALAHILIQFLYSIHPQAHINMDIDQLLNSVTSQIVDFLNEPDPIQIKNAVLYIVAGMCGLKFLKTLSSAYLLRKRLNFLPTAPTEILPWRMGGEKPGHTFDSHKIGNDAVVIFNFMVIKSEFLVSN